MIITKKNKQIYPYILAVVCTTAFFSFEYFPDKSSEYLIAKRNHTKAKKKRAIALNKLKDFAKGSVLYEKYLQEKIETDKAWQELKRVKKNDIIFGFTNTQQFLSELGWVLGLFLYSLFNLFRTYTSNNKELGYVFLHTTVLSISCFYLFWIFQPYQDIAKMYYYLMSVISGIVVSYSVCLMSRYKFSDVGKLQMIIRDLFDFILVDAQKEDFVKDEKKKYYEKKTLEIAKKALDNE
ncbi:conserved membrane hypothetical protein [Tenacibaculum amylolyticum]